MSEAIGIAAAEREAAELGRNYGTAGGSWVTDGNSSDDERRAVIQASENGEFYTLMDGMSGPLSGEWADGYTLGRLSDELGVDQESDEFDDLCTIFEDAYYQAFEDEAVRSARASLGDHEAVPSPHGMASGVFGTCVFCPVPVWREDHPGMGYTSLEQGTWQHVES